MRRALLSFALILAFVTCFYGSADSAEVYYDGDSVTRVEYLTIPNVGTFHVDFVRDSYENIFSSAFQFSNISDARSAHDSLNQLLNGEVPVPQHIKYQTTYHANTYATPYGSVSEDKIAVLYSVNAGPSFAGWGVYTGTFMTSPLPTSSVGDYAVFRPAGATSGPEIEIALHESVISFTPIFEEGHAGDLSRVVGFSYEADYLIGEPRVKIATETGEVRLPAGKYFSSLTRVLEGQVTGTLMVPGIGGFSIKGTLIGLGGPNAAATGDVVVSWVQSYFDGTGLLAGFYGLGSGTGKLNLITNVGENPFKMILMPPINQ